MRIINSEMIQLNILINIKYEREKEIKESKTFRFMTLRKERKV